MRRTSLIVFALLLVCVLSAPLESHKKKKHSNGFDYLILTLFQAASQPLTNSRCYLPKGVSEISIHGLWPTNFTSRGPNTCGGDPFSTSVIADLKDDMIAMYPSYMSPDDGFHDHEWTKHGTCAVKGKVGEGTDRFIHDEHSYFKFSLDWLKSEGDLMGLLAKEDITPSKTKGYEYNDIINALHYGSGHLIAINCAHSGQLDKTLWVGATACFNKKLEQMDCPLGVVQKGAHTCNERIYIIPLEN